VKTDGLRGQIRCALSKGRLPVFHFSASLLINRPLAEVWRALIDFPAIPTWEQGVLEVRQTSPGRPGVGTTLVARRVYGGRETLVECRITEWEELRGATMALHGGPLRHASVRYAVEPAGATAGDEQAIVTYTAEGELRPALIFLTPFMPAMGRAGARRNLSNLKRRLETPDQGASRS
jgi:Polyketide cyclase / dehydrase and lipid transport